MKEKIELNADAMNLRQKIGEDASSPIDVFAIIQNFENLTLIFYPMSERISGMCIRSNQDALIAINSTLSMGRQRFTVAHELYHLFIQKSIKSVICGKEIGEAKDVEEKNADTFASYFLAPYNSLKQFITNEVLKNNERELTLADVIKVEQYFQMSHQATLYRLVSEGYITREISNKLKTGVIQSARTLGYRTDLYSPTQPNKQFFTTGKYIELVEQVKGQDIISQGKYEEFLLDAYRPDIVYNLGNESDIEYD